MEEPSVLADHLLLSFLSSPQSYPHRPRRVELLQTHISYVAIAPPYVFKVKKPVNFGFVDFSTLEKRRYYSVREVELNRRFCPEVYLGVVPIYAEGSNLRFGAGQRVAEYAVQMRRLRRRYFLRQLLARGEVGEREIETIAQALARFYHAESPILNAVGALESFRRVTEENFRQTRSSVGVVLSRATYEALQYFTELFYALKGSQLDQRKRDGWVRDCHGDLHSEHIHLAPKGLCIYDCIEFNDEFRCIDVAYDFAFLAMDLHFLGYPSLAEIFLGRMIEELADPGCRGVLDFYCAQRAYIRGKVACFKANDTRVPEKERTEAVEIGRRYFALALQYALCGLTTTAVVVMGKVGTGKSTLAEALARETSLPYLSTDCLRKELLGLPPTYRPGEAQRQEFYREEAVEQVYQVLYERAESFLRKGQSVVLDGTFGKRSRREALRNRLKSLGKACVFIEVDTPDPLRVERVTVRSVTQSGASDAQPQDLAVLDSLYESPEELEPSQRVRVSGVGSSEEVVSRALLALIQKRLLQELS